MESEEVMVELANEGNETEDPLAKVNPIDTSAHANLLMGTPSIRQVCPWISDGTAGNISVEEIEIEEIKIESTDTADPSWNASGEPLSQIAPGKGEGIGQLVLSVSGTSPNENQHRRLRCNFCSLLFFSEKTLANHEKKCQLVSEIINAPKAVPVRETNDILEDLQKRLPQFTVAITGNEDVGTSSRADDGTPRSHHRRSAFSVPIDVTVSIVPKLEAPSSPISILNTDPLKLEATLVQESSNSIHIASISPCTSSTVPCSSSFVSTTSGEEFQCQERNDTLPRKTGPSDITDHLERIENKLAILSKENCLLREALAVSMDLPMVKENGDLNVFDFERLDTPKQLVEFEEKLGKDAAFADYMVSLLKLQTAKSNPKNRIVLSLDFLFSRQLFASCSWTGAGKTAPKIPFCKYINIQSLLKRVSGLPGISVEKCLRNRVCYSKKRLQGIPGRKPFCHLKQRTYKMNASKDGQNKK